MKKKFNKKKKKIYIYITKGGKTLTSYGFGLFSCNYVLIWYTLLLASVQSIILIFYQSLWIDKHEY